MEIQWKKIIINGQETCYSVSNTGLVRNDKKMTYLGGTVWNNGYRMVHLRYRIDKMCSVHRLVMKAFKPCEDMDDLQINHIDGNKLNNNLDNLEWSTALENMRYSYRMGLQKNSLVKCYQYDLDGNFQKAYESVADAARELQIDATSIHRCVKEEQQHYLKYQFKSYKKDKIKPWFNTALKAVYVYDDEGNFVKKYVSQEECAKDFGVSPSSICRYIKLTKKLRGFVFSRIPL
jgi:hypothetical protein